MKGVAYTLLLGAFAATFHGGDLPEDLQLKPSAQISERSFAHSTKIGNLVWHPNGKLIATSDELSTFVWNASDGRRPIRRHVSQIKDIRYAHRGHFAVYLKILNAHRYAVCLVDSGKTTPRWVKESVEPLWDLAISVNDEVIAVSGTATSFILASDTGRTVSEIKGHQQPISAIAFSSTGKQLLFGDRKGKIQVWNWKSKTLARTEQIHNGIVTNITPCRKGPFVFSGGGTRVVRWNYLTGEKTWESDKQINGIARMSIRADENYVAVIGATNNVRVLSMMPGEKSHVLRTVAIPSVVSWSPDGKYLVWGTTALEYFDWKTKRRLYKGRGHASRVTMVAFSSNNGQLVSTGEDQKIMVWDVESRRLRKQITPSLHPLATRNICTLSHDARRLVWGSVFGTIYRFDLAKGCSKLLVFYQYGKGPVNSLAGDRNGTHVAIGGGGGMIELRKTRDGSLVYKRKHGECNVSGLALSPDGRVLGSAGTDGHICVWEAKTGKFLKRIEYKGKLRSGGRSLDAIAISPDAKHIAVRRGFGAIELWNVASNKMIWTHGLDRTGLNYNSYNGIPCIAFSPDGRFVVAGGGDPKIRVYRTRSGVEVWQLIGNTSGVSCVGFSADGRKIASGAADGTILMWELPIDCSVSN